MKHGGDLSEAMAHSGGDAAAWLDLSTGINPWSWPSSGVWPDAVWQRLPSRADEAALLGAARAAYRVPAGTDLVAAGGTQALIQFLPYLAAPGPVAIVGPTYHEHAAAWRDAGHQVIMIDDFAALPGNVIHAVIVNPNNPDGRIAGHAALAEVAAELRRRGGWLVIDEAFADVDPASSAVALCEAGPIVILRSFGKFYGLAGLRLGFAIAEPAIAQRIAAALGPWAVSGPALRIGADALGNEAWSERMRAALTRQAQRLDAVLTEAGFEIVGGTSLFRLARHREALKLHAALARQQIWCRRFDYAEDWLRFGLPPDDAALERLAAALKSIV
ncbi:MAG: threonine-phosphate decarboxylase [Tardiphaga sp.]|nr:threonine-phosphate decarboxylase [Tardiphaga sp.]